MITIKTIKKLDCILKAPPSKSIINRALITAALAEGTTEIQDIFLCDDTRYMVESLIKFGIPIEIGRDSLKITGKNGYVRVPDEDLYIGNAGTTLRFLTTFAGLINGQVRLFGDDRMNQRPIQDLLDSLNSMGIIARSTRKNGCPPLIIESKGKLSGGEISIKGDKSSQYLSSLLLCSPYAGIGTKITIEGELTSKPYIDITLRVMADFGVKVENDDYRTFRIKSGQHYQSKTYQPEGDASNASYFFAAAAIIPGKIRITNLSDNSSQGDREFVILLEKMGCRINQEKNFLEVIGGELYGGTFDMNRTPDVVQTIAITALFAQGKTKIINVPNLRIKETDRISALVTELRKIGARAEELPDGLIIEPTGNYHGAEIETYNDHRMAMSFAIAGLKIPGIKITNPQCVHKSFPNFFEYLEKLHS